MEADRVIAVIGKTEGNGGINDYTRIITDPADVHYVQTKTPLLTIDTIRDAHERGQTTVLEEPHGSMDISNGTTALGIAVALGEIEMPTQEQIMRDLSLFSSVASCSSG